MVEITPDSRRRFREAVLKITIQREVVEELRGRVRFHKIHAKTFKGTPVDKARQSAKRNVYFRIAVISSAIMVCIEQFLVCYKTVGIPYVLQLIVLTISTILYFWTLHLTAIHIKSTDIIITYYQKFKACYDGEVSLETICLIFGWSCIFLQPSIAAIRSIRILRYLWYVELYRQKRPENELYIPKNHLINPIVTSQLCINYLEQIGTELFTAKSKGILLEIFLKIIEFYCQSFVCFK